MSTQPTPQPDIVTQMVQDPDFGKMAVSEQRKALAAHDPIFQQAGDDAIGQFVQAHQKSVTQQQQGLNPQEQQQLQQSLNARPLWRKVLGLGSSDPAAQQLQQKGMAAQRPNIEAGLRDYYQTNPGGMYGMGVASNLAQGAQDFSQGNIKKGIHSTAKGVGIASLPFLPAALANAPLATVAAAGTGVIGSKAASAGAGALGASPETQDLAGDIGGLTGALAGGYGTSRLVGSLPSKSAAGSLFSEASAAAGKTPIDLATPGNIALDMRQAASSGGRMPKVISDFLRRTTDPNRGPLTYDEARIFYQNAGSLAVNERNGLSPSMLRQLNQFRVALGSSIQGAANQAGSGQQYQGAMQQYRKAAQMQDFMNMLKQGAVKAGADVLPHAIGYGLLYKLLSGGFASKNQ